MSRQALAITHRESIIERVARGDRLADIARDIGLAGKGQAISNALAQDHEYQAAREWGLASRLDQREEEMETCSPQDVPRARELLSHARWRAERECPKRWGTKQQVEVTDSRLVLDDRLGDIADQVISRMRIVEVSHGEIVEVSDTETPGL